MNVQDWQCWKFFSYIEHPNCWFPCYKTSDMGIYFLSLPPGQQYSQHIALRWPMSMTKNIYNSITTQPTSHTSLSSTSLSIYCFENLPLDSSHAYRWASFPWPLDWVQSSTGNPPMTPWSHLMRFIAGVDFFWKAEVCVFVLRFHSEDIGFRRFNFWFKFKWKGSWWKFIEPGTWSWLLRFQDHSHQSWWFHYRQRHRWKFDTSRWLICAVGSGVSWGR